MPARARKDAPPRRVLLLALDRRGHGGIQRFVDSLERAISSSLGPDALKVVAVHPREGPVARTRLGTRARFLLAAARAARELRPDLIVCTHAALLHATRVVAGLARAPYWLVAHGIECWGPLPPSPMRRVSRVLAVSRFTAERVRSRHGVPASNLRVLPCPYEERFLALEQDPAVLPRLGLDGRRIMVTVARLSSAERYKGHDELIRAMPAILRSVPDAAYLVVGDGDDRERLQQLAEELGVARDVVFAGKLDDRALASCYAGASLFAMPARTEVSDTAPKGEGFGIAYLEAMAFGLPILGPSTGAPAEFIQDGKHGLLVDPTDVEAIASAASKLLGSPEDARRMGERARADVGGFSSSAFDARVAKLLQEGAA